MTISFLITIGIALWRAEKIFEEIAERTVRKCIIEVQKKIISKPDESTKNIIEEFNDKHSLNKTNIESSYPRNNKYNTVSFMDALSNEIMTMRSDLTNIKIKQAQLEKKDDINRSNPGNDIHHMLKENVSPCFIYKWIMASNYKSSYLCARYSIEENQKQGYIIVVFVAGNDFLFKDHFYDEYDSEKFKMLNDKHKIHNLKSGQNIGVYLWEPSFENHYLHDENYHWRDMKTAKILSVTQKGDIFDDYPTSSLAILEIQMSRGKIIEVEMRWGQCIPDKIIFNKELLS